MPTKKENILRNSKIFADLKSGKSYTEISEKYSITRERIRQIALNEGFVSINNQKRERNNKIIKDFKKERSTKKLVLKYKLSFARIGGIISESGQPTEFQTKTSNRNKKIAQLFHQGLSCVQIKAKYQLTYANILRILHLQGLYYMISPKEISIRNNKIIADVKSGKRYYEISDKYSIGAKRIKQIATEGGFSIHKVIKLRNAQIIQDFEKGIKKEKLAIKYKLAVSTVKLIVKQPKKKTKGNSLAI